MNLRFPLVVALFELGVTTALMPAYSADVEKLKLTAEGQAQQAFDKKAADGSEEPPLLLADGEAKKPVKLEPEAQAKPVIAEKAPPLPFHTIEGVGGGAITPIAYLVNPGPKGTVLGLPSGSFTYVNIRQKDLESLSFTETIFGRVELGYALERFNLGSLPRDIQKATEVDIGRSDVYLQNFNVRALVLEENSFNTNFLPAITAGAHFKVNDGIDQIDRKLGGALHGIGVEQSNGVDFTLTASKMFPKVFGRPLILSAGLRNSNAAWLGFMGFGDERATTFEGNVVYLPTDWLALAYEFRQNADPLKEIPGLVGTTDNWHAFDIGLLINKHCSLVLNFDIFGNMVNTTENSGLGIQFKYEF